MTRCDASHTKLCKNCRKTKPNYEYILGRNAHAQVTYSLICKSCRLALEKAAQKLKPESKAK